MWSQTYIPSKLLPWQMNLVFTGFVPLESHAGALVAALLVGVAVQEAMRLGCWALHRYDVQLSLCKAHACAAQVPCATLSLCPSLIWSPLEFGVLAENLRGFFGSA